MSMWQVLFFYLFWTKKYGIKCVLTQIFNIIIMKNSEKLALMNIGMMFVGGTLGTLCLIERRFSAEAMWLLWGLAFLYWGSQIILSRYWMRVILSCGADADFLALKRDVRFVHLYGALVIICGGVLSFRGEEGEILLLFFLLYVIISRLTNSELRSIAKQ